MVMSLDKSLNGGYKGLYGEVVTDDIYHMRDVSDIVSINDPSHIHEKGHAKGFNFIPDVIFDLGANVGIFSRYARTLFPDALIVSVEPDDSNCEVFRNFTNDPKIILLQKAIGNGKIFRCIAAKNGAMEVYISEGIGFGKKYLTNQISTDVESIMITDLKKYIKPSDKVILKLDIEGNETVIFSDKASMEMLKAFDYIAIELHYYASDGNKLDEVVKITNEALDSFKDTHDIHYEHIYFYATKKIWK